MPDKKNPRPYAKLNLLSRKGKDKREIAAMSSAMSQGKDYSFVKKSKKAMELPDGQKVTKRGSTVSATSKMKTGTTGGSMTADLKFEKGKETKTYEKADVRTEHKGYGPESKTKPTPKFVTDAQSQKKDIVWKDDKPYRAGYTTIKKEPDKVSVGTNVKPGKITMERKQSISVKEPAAGGMGRASGKGPMRKRLPVDYLIGERGKGLQNYQKRTKKRETGY